MKKNHRVFVLMISMLVCGLVSSCTGGNEAVPTQTAAPPTFTPLPTEPPPSTPTEAPVPTSTPIPSPTPVPGQFVNRPAYLKELLPDTNWYWFDNPAGLLGVPYATTSAIHMYSPSTKIVFIYKTDDETANWIRIRGIFDIDPEARREDEEFFKEFVSTLMQDFLPSSALSGFNKFFYTNVIKPAPGFYENTIEEFGVVMKVEDDQEDNEHNIWLEINEK